MNKSFACALVLATAVLLSVVAAAARQQSPAPLAATQLALEIVFLKGQPPSLYPVASQQAKPSGGYATRFGRIVGWQPPEGALPVRAVQVVSRLAENFVRVQISVLSGRESIEREEPVTTVEISEDKQVVINELTRFGVEPIEIKAVRVIPRRTVLPQIVNKTDSLIMTEIIVGTSTLPSYQLSLQNVSTKDIVAMEVNIVLSGKKEIIMMPKGEEGRALIPAGSQYKLVVSGAYQVRPAYGEHPPDFSREHDCVITSALFRDGSYEGDPVSAARFRATVRGQQLQLPRVVALLQEALSSTADVGTTVQRLRAGLSSLKTEADEPTVAALLGEFPDLSANAKTALISVLRAALNSIKKTASEEFDRFEKAQAAPDKSDWQAWLLATKRKYEEWLSKL